MKFAILFFSLALQSVSPEAAQHMQTGVEAHKQGRLDLAIAEFRKATEAAPNLPEAFLDLGEVYAETGNYAAAIAPLKRALELKDRKSTRLNSSHPSISYAVFCLKKKSELVLTSGMT